MEIVLGVSMTPTTVSIALVEGEKADGVILEHDVFDISASDGSATSSASDHVIAAILGTQEGAIGAGHHLVSTGVTWTDHAEAAVLREALVARGVEDVLLVSELHAAAALAQAVGRAMGYDKTALMFVERDTATLAVVETVDGSVVKVLRAKACPMATRSPWWPRWSPACRPRNRLPQGLFVVGSGVDVTAVKAHLQGVVSVPVIAPEEPELALARGAALASASAPRYDTSTIGLAYSQDLDGTTDYQLALADDATAFLGAADVALTPPTSRRTRRRGGTPQAVPASGQLAGRHLRSGNDGTDHRIGDQYPADRGSGLGGHGHASGRCGAASRMPGAPPAPQLLPPTVPPPLRRHRHRAPRRGTADGTARPAAASGGAQRSAAPAAPPPAPPHRRPLCFRREYRPWSSSGCRHSFSHRPSSTRGLVAAAGATAAATVAGTGTAAVTSRSPGIRRAATWSA